MLEPLRFPQLVALIQFKGCTIGGWRQFDATTQPDRFGTPDRGIGCIRRGLRAGRGAFRFVTVWIALLSPVIQSGCATLPPQPSAELRAQVRRVAIVPARYVPDSNFVAFAKGKVSGGARGALAGVGPVLIVGVPATIATGGIAGGIMAFQMLLYAGVAATAGSIAGALEAVPPEKARAIEQAIADAVDALDAQQTLARHLASALQRESVLRLHSVAPIGPATPADRPSYADLKAAGVDTVLEISVTEIGFEVCSSPLVYPKCPGKPANPLISLFAKSHARLVRVADGAEVYARTFWYESRPRTIQEWAEKDSQTLTQAFDLGWRDLAARIADELFVVTPIPLPTPGMFATRWNPYAGHCWLRPIYPETSRPKVDSRRPQLRWEPFPRTLDHERGDPALIAKIRDVTYDLKIWEPDDDAPGRLVYERTGLPEPSHQVQLSLEPERRYFWTFRARFTVDGQPMATRWAFARFLGSWEHGPRDERGAHLLEVCHSDQIDFHNYYRFVTPKDDGILAPLEQEMNK